MKYQSLRLFLDDVPEMITSSVNTVAARLRTIGKKFQHTRNPFAIIFVLNNPDYACE
jgi:hypothetical protein